MTVITRAQARRAFLRAVGAGRPGRKPVLLTMTARREVAASVAGRLRAGCGIDRALSDAARAFGLSLATTKRVYYAHRSAARRLAAEIDRMQHADRRLRALCDEFPQILAHESTFDTRRVQAWADELDRAYFSARGRIEREIDAVLQGGELPNS